MPSKEWLQERSIEHLRGLCLKAGLDSSGDKKVLIKRLLSPKEGLPPLPTEPEPEPAPEPEPEPEPEP